MSDLRTWLALETRRSTLLRHSGNQARRAVALHTYQTTGWGVSVEPEVFSFQTTFYNKPNFTSAYDLNETDANGDSQDLEDGRFPRAQAFVYKWRRDDHGHYTGAWVAINVDTVGVMEYVPGADYISTDPGYVLNHHLHFTGIGTKNLSRSALKSL